MKSLGKKAAGSPRKFECVGKSGAVLLVCVRESVTIFVRKESFVPAAELRAEITLKARRRNNFPSGSRNLGEGEDTKKPSCKQ